MANALNSAVGKLFSTPHNGLGAIYPNKLFSPEFCYRGIEIVGLSSLLVSSRIVEVESCKALQYATITKWFEVLAINCLGLVQMVVALGHFLIVEIVHLALLQLQQRHGTSKFLLVHNITKKFRLCMSERQFAGSYI